MLLLKEAKVQQAIDISNQGIEKFPQNPSLFLINAAATYKRGEKQKALVELQKAKRISSDPKIDQIYEAIQNGSLSL